MIRYALRCREGHVSDSWFFDAAAFDQLAGRGLVTCPTCGSHDVEKAIMAPAIVGRRAPRAPAALEPQPRTEIVDPPEDGGAAATVPERQPMALVDDEKRDMVRALHKKIVAETRDVGSSFVDEARRIHANDTQERIRGQASLEEARELIEDGIMVLPLPIPPDDFN